MANTATGTEKAKEKGQKDKIGIDDIGIFEFIFYGLPEPPELEGVDEDRLRELQNAVQEQLCQRDEERERNITKRVQEFKKTFDFVNSHLLKGVATMAELTKADNRLPMGKIKPTDKGAKPKQTRGRGKPQEQRQNPPKAQEADETYTYENPNNYYQNAPSQSRSYRPYNGQGSNQQFRGFIQ